jgi:hypothetical protein
LWFALQIARAMQFLTVMNVSNTDIYGNGENQKMAINIVFYAGKNDHSKEK